MGWRSIGPYPRQRLAHHTGSNLGAGTMTHHFRTQPIRIVRPEVGVAEGAVTCATCGRRLVYRVHCPAATRGFRRRWLALGAASVAVFAVAAAVVVHLATAEADDVSALATFALVAGVFGGAASAIFWFLLWLQEDGVRGPGTWFERGRGHTLR